MLVESRAALHALIEVISSEEYRSASHKQQAGEPLTEEEQRVLASGEMHAKLSKRWLRSSAKRTLEGTRGAVVCLLLHCAGGRISRFEQPDPAKPEDDTHRPAFPAPPGLASEAARPREGWHGAAAQPGQVTATSQRKPATPWTCRAVSGISRAARGSPGRSSAVAASSRRSASRGSFGHLFCERHGSDELINGSQMCL